jgi:hypothetical protein
MVAKAAVPHFAGSNSMLIYHADATGCSFDGVNYTPDATGAFDVPQEALEALQCMGFTTQAPIAEADAVPVVALTGNPAKWTNDVLASEATRLGLDATLARPALIKAVAEARKAEADAACVEAEAE